MKKFMLFLGCMFFLSLITYQNANAFLGIHLRGKWQKGTNSKDCACCGRGTCTIEIDVGTDLLTKMQLGTADNGNLAIGVKESDIDLDEVQGFMENGKWKIGNAIELSDKSQQALASQGYNITLIKAGMYSSHKEGDWIVFDLGIKKDR